MVVDFWSCRSQPGIKVLGLRVYFVDEHWMYRSILGYRTPFKRWIIDFFHNFGLNLACFYGSTTDAGGCGVSHLTNAAIKTAFGITLQRSASKNPELTDLMSRIAKTIYTIRSNDSMGSLFAEMCQQLRPDGTTQLLSYKEHRFMRLTRDIRRILEKWAPLEHLFEERRAKAIKDRKDPPHDFPLIEDKATLTQLLALLDPITPLSNILAQIKNVRYLLVNAFHKDFFSRYIDRAKMRETSFILEGHMCLHPVFKNPERGLTKIVRICSNQLIIDRANPQLRADEQTVQRNVDKVKEYVRMCVVSLMLAIAVAEADIQQSTRTNSPSGIPPPIAAYSEELTDKFGDHPAQREQSNGHEGRVEEEYDRWLTDIVTLERNANGEVESILFGKDKKKPILITIYRMLLVFFCGAVVASSN
ncbi:Hypothetical protein PHPALM_18579 [Phytophthora palmivora]|uniref:Uncharacterized protein n=1 Tax=Phytophthora palmivora TaxID=4796 RepID=A0A2P4XJD3_9STRA|nr:Hypothetical protein PHPALM_18579 [Phytophthora palmivora]